MPILKLLNSNPRIYWNGRVGVFKMKKYKLILRSNPVDGFLKNSTVWFDYIFLDTLI